MIKFSLQKGWAQLPNTQTGSVVIVANSIQGISLDGASLGVVPGGPPPSFSHRSISSFAAAGPLFGLLR
jgi:hypothetical protein